MWSDVKDGLVYGYEFMKGLVFGLKDQVTGLWELVSNPGEVFSGMVALGKAFYDDPDGTLAMLGELLGQEVVDSIKRATQCGAYDLGKVIGENVNPAFVLKLATRIAKYSGDLATATRQTKLDLGCASFAANTLVLTPQGTLPIERIRAGQQVLSRDDRIFRDAPQAVERTFARTAPGYRLLTTEFDQFRLTDEHPLWVQGHGWTPAQYVTDDDILASARGDTRVLGNEAVHEPIAVYNFSVAHTPSYFVGFDGIWAHNAKCDIAVLTKPWKDLTSKEKGFRGELQAHSDMKDAGYQPVGKSSTDMTRTDIPPHERFNLQDGKQGIDGIYKDKNGNYVLIESKATGGTKKEAPNGTKERLTETKNGTQMSPQWIDNHLSTMVNNGEISATEKIKIMDGLKNGSTRRIYAQTDVKGTSYHEVVSNKNSKGELLPLHARVSSVVWKP